MVDAQPHQRLVEIVQQRAPGGVDDPPPVTAVHPGLGADHHNTPVDLGQQPSEQQFARPGPETGRGVEKRTTRLKKDRQLLTRLVLVGVAAPHHRAQAHGGHP